MTIDEAEEIIRKANEWENESCSCHLSAPCSKCENMPTPEEIEDAEEIVLARRAY